MIKKFFTYYRAGKNFLNNDNIIYGKQKSIVESQKNPIRSEVVNFLLSLLNEPTYYLEIGVRNPEDNYLRIKATHKYGVDPGYEFSQNPVDFQMTSDEFFQKIKTNEILNSNIKFDIIFIDGLHTAVQADRDICNSINYIKQDGFVVVHDCNPPTEWHARETNQFDLSPAGYNWNGTTWKAFFKQRLNSEVSCVCIDSDWGIGIIQKNNRFEALSYNFNPFYDYSIFNSHRKESLNLMSFNEYIHIITR